MGKGFRIGVKTRHVQYYEVWIDKVRHKLDEQDLANLLKQKIPKADKDKAIRLLSCSDINSAKGLSKALDGRKIIASDESVVLYLDDNNNIVSVQSGQWKEITSNTQKDYTPDWDMTTKTGKFVRMGNYKFGEALPDEEIIIYATNPTVGSFKIREGVDDLPLSPPDGFEGKVLTQKGKSVSLPLNSPIQEHKSEFLQIFPNKKFSRGDRLAIATVKDIRDAGFDVIFAPTINKAC